MFFSRTTGSISTTLGTNYPWVKGIHFCSNEGPCPFPRGDNNEITKTQSRIFKIFFSRTPEPISTKIGKNHPWVKGIHFFSIEGHCPFPREDNNETVKNTLTNLKNHLLPEQVGQFQPYLAQSILG